VRATRVDEAPTGARFVVTGDEACASRARSAPRPSASSRGATRPGRPEHHSAHTSLADLRVQVRRNPGANVEFVLPMTASYELGMHETDHGLEVQPYADGRL
jgi:hypothetical protein